MKSDILLITPPFTQLNTPYPATAYLKGFLNTKSISSFQVDLGIEVILNLFSKKGLTKLFSQVNSLTIFSKNTERIYALKNDYINTIDHVTSFLQGNNSSLAHLINGESYLPEASRFNDIEDMDWSFGNMGNQDRAKYLATLYIEDISDFIIELIDPEFGFSRYAERISESAFEFDEIYNHLESSNTYISDITIPILKKFIDRINPKIICLSIPFPGNLFMALKCAQFIKQNYPTIKLTIGGGYPNTELRSISDNRIFEFVDFICLDDGEAPIEQIYEHVINHRPITKLKRTFTLINNTIEYIDNKSITDYPQKEVGTPDYSNLKLDQYISVIEVANPMHSLWSDGRWNKLTLAHGCYWAKCTFCDVSLDYISNYDPLKASLICDRIEEMISQTNESGFHFVDEAAPPSLMKNLALEIIRRNISISWWTNIRFEKNFTADLCTLLKKSGCIAVSGGIEVASDRLLKLIDKGVDLHQLAHVTRNFKQSGIMVHAYLMYGFPTQTDQETVNSLEVVRQLFEQNCIDSGFWHQFAMTAHSPIGLNPEKFNVINTVTRKGKFANNDLPHVDPIGCEHKKYSEGLKLATYNYMRSSGFEIDLQNWFNFNIKTPTISSHFITELHKQNFSISIRPNTIVVWTGGSYIKSYYKVKKKGKEREMAKLIIHSINNQVSVKDTPETINLLFDLLNKCKIETDLPIIKFKEFQKNYESISHQNIDVLLNSTTFEQLQANGLLFI